MEIYKLMFLKEWNKFLLEELFFSENDQLNKILFGSAANLILLHHMILVLRKTDHNCINVCYTTMLVLEMHKSYSLL